MFAGVIWEFFLVADGINHASAFGHDEFSAGFDHEIKEDDAEGGEAREHDGGAGEGEKGEEDIEFFGDVLAVE